MCLDIDKMIEILNNIKSKYGGQVKVFIKVNGDNELRDPITDNIVELLPPRKDDKFPGFVTFSTINKIQYYLESSK